MTNADTWTDRDLPVLRAAARLIDEGGPIRNERALEEAAGLDRQDVIRALVVLNGEYLTANLMGSSSKTVLRYNVDAITPAGLRAAGQWPSPEIAADRLLAALDALIDATPENSPKASKLRSIRDGFTGITRDLFVEIAGAVVTGRLPV